MSKLKPRERDAIVQALRAGVVPKLGLRHIQVGRVREIEELVKDMDRISDGGSAIRFIIGEYGSGKTFFMNLIRLVALPSPRVPQVYLLHLPCMASSESRKQQG